MALHYTILYYTALHVKISLAIHDYRLIKMPLPPSRTPPTSSILSRNASRLILSIPSRKEPKGQENRRSLDYLFLYSLFASSFKKLHLRATAMGSHLHRVVFA